MANVANLTTILAAESTSFLSAIEQSRGGLKSLIASLDPAAAATDRFNRQSALLENGLKRGALTADQYGVAMQRLSARHQEAISGQRGLTVSSGQMRAGMQQLGFQLGDVATQFASGTRPMIIFAQQSGQIIQALGMMTTKTSGLLGFLGGPWGAVISAASIVLLPLISNLFESGDAASKAAKDIDGYTASLKRLQDQAGSFSFGSPEFGKVQKAYLESEARVGRLRAEHASGGAGPMVMTPGGTAPATGRSSEMIAVDLAAAERDRDARKAEYNALFMQRRNRQIADGRTPDAGGGGRGDRSRSSGANVGERQDSRADSELAQLEDQRLSLLSSITTDLGEKARLEHLSLENDLEAYRNQIQHQVALKQISDERGKELIAAKEANNKRQHTLVNWRLDDALAADQLRTDQAALDNRRELLSGQLSEARTQADRRRIGLQILQVEYERQRVALEEVMHLHSSSEAEKKIAEKRLLVLEKLQTQDETRLNRSTLNPMAAWLDTAPKTAAELKETLESIEVRGIEAANDDLANMVTSTLKLHGALGQITNDLIHIVLKMLEARAINMFSGSKTPESKAGGIADKIGAVVNILGAVLGGGKGEGLGASIGSKVPGFANGGMLRVGGMGGVDSQMLSIGGVPRAMVSPDEFVGVGKPMAAQNGSRPIVFDMRGAVVTEDLLRQMDVIASDKSAQVLRTGARGMARSRAQALA